MSEPTTAAVTVGGFTVKAALTPGRRRRVVENDEYAGFSRRVLRAHGRRIARGDVEGLADLAQLADAVQTATRTAVTGLRGEGYSWTEIADRLGVTRQAAQERVGGAP